MKFPIFIIVAFMLVIPSMSNAAINGVFFTELHIRSLYGNTSEQWVEIYNSSSEILNVENLRIITQECAYDPATRSVTACPSQGTPILPIGPSSIAPNQYYVITFGMPSSSDFLYPSIIDGVASTGVPLSDEGVVTLANKLADGSLAVIDQVDYRRSENSLWGSLLDNLRVNTDGRMQSFSLLFLNDTTLGNEENDFPTNWCVASTRIENFYSCTGNHFGSPGAAGTCESVPNNAEPIAEAGADTIAKANQIVFLNASSSYDPDGEIVNYTWRTLPEGNLICNTPEPTCEILALGYAEEVIELTVRDNLGASGSDVLTIYNPGVAGIAGPPGPEGPQGPPGECDVSPERLAELLYRLEMLEMLGHNNRLLLEQLPQLQKKIDELGVQVQGQ